MLERWIVKHWIALSAGCLLMAAAVRMAYAQRGYAAIGGEELVFLELFRVMLWRQQWIDVIKHCEKDTRNL